MITRITEIQHIETGGNIPVSNLKEDTRLIKILNEISHYQQWSIEKDTIFCKPKTNGQGK